MLAVRQALTAVNAVTRTCAWEAGLEQSEALVLGLVLARPRRSASEVALMTGQSRQQAHRTLQRLARRGLVEPAGTQGGKVIGWRLTSAGVEVWEDLRERMRRYEEIMGDSAALWALVLSLERVVGSVVNRPRAVGWRYGLVRPLGAKTP